MRRRTQLAAVFLTLMALPATAQDWCNAARLNITERTICTTPALQWRDEALNKLWDYNDGGRGLSVPQAQWLDERDSCGRDVLCIANAYDRRINDFDALAARKGRDLRPWCDASRLNPTEQTICTTPELADFDAALAAIYGRIRSRDESQDRWLRDERDACGSDPVCIGRRYIERIRTFGRLLRETED